MNNEVYHVCIGGFPRHTACIFRKPVLVKGVMFYSVQCPLCKKEMTVNSQGQILN